MQISRKNERPLTLGRVFLESNGRVPRNPRKIQRLSEVKCTRHDPQQPISSVARVGCMSGFATKFINFDVFGLHVLRMCYYCFFGSFCVCMFSFLHQYIVATSV